MKALDPGKSPRTFHTLLVFTFFLKKSLFHAHSESEAAVQEALNELLQSRFGMTTIVIAHRLQTVRCADTIFVMKNGSLVESGAHDQLLGNLGGHYRRMLDRVDSAGHLPE